MKNFSKLLHHNHYELEINGEAISVHDGVFAPDKSLSRSTSIILENLPEVSGKSVLDLGTGTGVIAIICSKNKAAKVVASDIDTKALKNAEENIKKSKADNIQLIESDLYENINGSFDYIFANLPINEELWGENSDPVALIKKFLFNTHKHANPGAKIYLPWFSISDVQKVKEAATNLGYTYEIVTENALSFEWYLLILESDI